jgi:lipoprotein-anchoring transpeptidase ErfK/SrfK
MFHVKRDLRAGKDFCGAEWPEGPGEVARAVWIVAVSHTGRVLTSSVTGRSRATTTRSSGFRPGPNNPVGLVFIALIRPTYGLHGPPDPSKINKSSHGCVRMRNWDDNELVHLVKRGIVVRLNSSRPRSMPDRMTAR